jgi:Arc/MetJ family transcription regulator
MRRTNLVLDGDLLEEATRAFGVRTYSATVNLALKEALRLHKVQALARFFGQDLWVGDLSEMRADRFSNRPRPAGQRGRRKR